MIVARRVAYLMRVGQSCRNLDASLSFDPDEIGDAIWCRSRLSRPNRPASISCWRWRTRRKHDLAGVAARDGRVHRITVDARGSWLSCVEQSTLRWPVLCAGLNRVWATVAEPRPAEASNGGA